MSAIMFFAASGAESSVNAGAARQQIWDLVAGGDTDTPSRIGFFGAAGQGAAVLLNHHNNAVYIVDKTGTVWSDGGSGQLVPMKYIAPATVLMSGAPAGNGWNWDLSLNPVPPESGTLLIRFAEPTGGAVQTLNATFRSVLLTAADVVEDNTVGADASQVEIQALECSREGFLTMGDRKPSMDGNGLSGYEGSNDWTQIDDTGVNQLALWDHPWTAAFHDFAVGISVKPTTTGGITTFGFMVVLDYV